MLTSFIFRPFFCFVFDFVFQSTDRPTFTRMGSRDGAVVRAFAFRHCGPGSIPGLGVITVGWICCWLSSLLWEVFPWVLRFSPLLKNQHFQIPIRSRISGPQVFQSLQTVNGHPHQTKLIYLLIYLFFFNNLLHGFRDSGSLLYTVSRTSLFVYYFILTEL